MSNYFEFLRKYEMNYHEEKLKSGYVVIPYSIRKYFNYNVYIHKDELKELANFINSLKE